MRRILTGLLLFFPLLAAAQIRPAYGALEDSEAVAAMKEHVGFLASAALEGRKAGSEGEREAAAYVSEILESYGLDVLSGKDGDIFGLKRENVYVSNGSDDILNFAFMAFAGRGNQTEIHAGCEKLLRVVFFMYVLNKRRNIQSPVFDIGKECLLHFLIFHECIQIEIQRICPVDDL